MPTPNPCATGDGKPNTCTVGDPGPGGGIVFYADEAAAFGFRYMQAAPANWSGSGDPKSLWCNDPTLIAGTDETAIGSGKRNTDHILASGGCTSSAAKIAREYGPYEIWSLPSSDELRLLTKVGPKAGLPDDSQIYWSSSQSNATQALVMVMGSTEADTKPIPMQKNVLRFMVRPVSEFGHVHVPLNLCATGDGKPNTCTVGDIGPGGGKIFYVDEAKPTGSRYMEAIVAGMTPAWDDTNADSDYQWCVGTGQSTNVTTGTAIGAG